MKLTISRSKNSTSFYVHESYRNEKGHSTTRVVEKLGTAEFIKSEYGVEDPEKWAREYVANLNRELKQKKQEELANAKNKQVNITLYEGKEYVEGEKRSFNVGYLAIQKALYSLGFKNMCSKISDKYKFEYNLERIVADLIYGRIMNPCSKEGTFEHWESHSLEEEMYDQHQIYRSLDVLHQESDFIQSYLYKASTKVTPRNFDAVYYDCTNFYFEIDEEEKKFVLSIIQMCNSMMERNNKEYKSNQIVYSLLGACKFIEHNDVDDKYYINLTAYKTVCFERKYREYVQQLPVLMKGMQAYGYEVCSVDRKSFECEGMEDFQNLKDIVKLAYDEQLMLNTEHIEELMEKIDENSLPAYKQVLGGLFDIKKGNDWKIDMTNEKMIVKNIEVFEKVIPFFISFSKKYDVDEVKKIFEHCRNKNKTFNFAALGRIRTLVNLTYNDKNNRLDFPIKEFMEDAYRFSDRGEAKMSEIIEFCNMCAERYATRESKGDLIITHSLVTMEKLRDKFLKLFRCLINVGRAQKKKDNRCPMERIELLWQEKEFYTSTNLNEKIFVLTDLLGIDNEVTSEVIN